MRLVNVPGDGNCFYNAFGIVAGLSATPDELRALARDHMSEDERMLARIVARQEFTDEDIMTRWADDYDINALVRAHPGICLLILDADERRVYAIENYAHNTRTVAVQKKQLHYSALFFDEKLAKRLRRRLYRTMCIEMPHTESTHDASIQWRIVAAVVVAVVAIEYTL